MTRVPERNLIVGVAAAIAATLFFGATLSRALGVERSTGTGVADEHVTAPQSEAEPGPEVAPDESAAPRVAPDQTTAPQVERPVLTRTALLLAVDNDPFREDRQRPPQRYLLPGERREDQPAPELPPAPPFRIVGTAVTAAGGLALVQIEEASPRLIGMGESLLGYTLERVDGESATLVGQGRTLQLPVMRMLVAQQQEQPRGRAGRGAGRGGRGANTREAEAQNARQREIMELLRGAVGNTGVQLENGRMIFRPRVRADTLDAPSPRVRQD